MTPPLDGLGRANPDDAGMEELALPFVRKLSPTLRKAVPTPHLRGWPQRPRLSISAAGTQAHIQTSELAPPHLWPAGVGEGTDRSHGISMTRATAGYPRGICRRSSIDDAAEARGFEPDPTARYPINIYK